MKDDEFIFMSLYIVFDLAWSWTWGTSTIWKNLYTKYSKMV